MTLCNMRALGVQRSIASCLNDACRHTAVLNVSSYLAVSEVPSFGLGMRLILPPLEAARFARNIWL
jgi:hypothetical protein